jgi:hypothetical protein
LVPSIIERTVAAGHKIFEAPFSVNIIGVRAAGDPDNTFNDSLHLCYTDSGARWVERVYPITTDPGRHYLDNPMNENGCAILAAGQYRATFARGQHSAENPYECLVQVRNVNIYRIKGDERVGPASGIFGIQIHRANANSPSEFVNKWSAGCQVFQDPTDFADFMSTVKTSMDIYGARVTYTLLEE